MPRLLKPIPDGTKQASLNVGFESQVVTWLLQDGWQVFTPVLDHGHKTDVLISDGERYFRIQIKTVDAKKGKKQEINNLWGEANIDFVIYFARNGEWGYIVPAFQDDKKILDAPEHKMFPLKRRDFLCAFHTIDQIL